MPPEDRSSLDALAQALDRLDEALAMDAQGQSIVRDGRIQRFEFCIELAWKNLKRQLAAEGVPTGTPKQALREAYAAGWLDDEATWLAMLEDRNLSSHTYRESLAIALESRLPAYAMALRQALQVLQQRWGT